MRPQRWQPTRLPHLWDSPGKNTGVGCHFLLQCMKVKSESEGTQSCPTFSDPMDCSLPGSSIHGIFQTRVLEWGAIRLVIDFLYTEEQFEPEQGLLYLILKDLNLGSLRKQCSRSSVDHLRSQVTVNWRASDSCLCYSKREKTLKMLPACGKYTGKNYSMPAEFMFLIMLHSLYTSWWLCINHCFVKTQITEKDPE